MNEKSKELEKALTQLESYVQEFEELQKITSLSKQGKAKLTDEQMQRLEDKYLILAKKMEDLNKKIKTLKNN